MITSRLMGTLAIASALSVAPAFAKGPATSGTAKKAHPDITQPAASSGPKTDPVGNGRVLDPPGGGLHTDHIIAPSQSSGAGLAANSGRRVTTNSGGRVLDPPPPTGNPDHILAPQTASGPGSSPTADNGHVFRVIPPPPRSAAPGQSGSAGVHPDHILAPQTGSGTAAPSADNGHVFRVIPPPPENNSAPSQQ